MFEALRRGWSEDDDSEILGQPELLGKVASAALDDYDWVEMLESMSVEAD